MYKSNEVGLRGRAAKFMMKVKFLIRFYNKISIMLLKKMERSNYFDDDGSDQVGLTIFDDIKC